jgi:hypothetical protein
VCTYLILLIVNTVSSEDGICSSFSGLEPGGIAYVCLRSGVGDILQGGSKLPSGEEYCKLDVTSCCAWFGLEGVGVKLKQFNISKNF